jgi:hypothetical protein
MFLLEEALYTEGPFFLLFTSLLFLCRHRYFFFLALASSSKPPSAPPLHAHQEGCAQSEDGEEREQEDGSQLGSFIFDEPDLKKAKKEGFLPAAAPVIFPGDERVPKPPKGYRVMFLAFLFHGLSLPAHEFLHGLLFVYGVQLHQLTPNSIRPIACFVTLYESFLGIDPH